MPRSRERAHRELLTQPYSVAFAPARASRLRPIETLLSDEMDVDMDVVPETSSDLPHHLELPTLDPSLSDAGEPRDLSDDEALLNEWCSYPPSTSSDDSGEEEEVGNEDSEASDDDLPDWDSFEKMFSASFGEEYERHAAGIADKLSAYDRAICRAFAYKIQTHTTDRDFAKLPFAFPCDPPLPKLDSIRARVAFLSGFKPEVYDCCVNSCCCFVGPNENLHECPHCREPRKQANGKPRKRFVYILLIPRLVAYMGNMRMAQLMHYHAEHQHKPGMTTDVFDGELYQLLRSLKVEIDGKKLSHAYFSDDRDIALGLSTDGFCPWKKRKSSAWPLIIFNYNLPPEIHFHLEHILAVGVIPGPKKPTDPDSFLWPLTVELLKLMKGVRAFDILGSHLFDLRAYLILMFGDMPAVALIMHMKGHNGITPCRMCMIHGLRVPGTRASTHYVPLDRSRHPIVRANPQLPKTYDPANLPLRSHEQFLAHANEVQSASTNVDADRLAKLYGIKSVPILSRISSLRFPASFPHDFMHLIDENNLKNLIMHWTGTFKDLNAGSEQYELPKTVWEAIGEATAKSGSTIPSAYGSRVPNIATDRSNISAEMWSFWALYLGPILLRRRFQRPKYFKHFILLVQILNICLQFEISDKEIEDVRKGLIQWVTEYEKIYYQHDPSRISACPVTIHALLHIADSIKAAGPVWCYWAFPMERYCGKLQPAIRSRRFPFAALDRYVLEEAQLTQIKVIYDLVEELSLRPPPSTFQGFRHPSYPTCVLLPPSIHERPAENLISHIAAAFRTRAQVEANAGPPHPQTRPGAKKGSVLATVAMSEVKRHLRTAEMQQWGKVRRVDSDEGDTMRAALLGSTTEDSRDATFVRYEMYVDQNAAHRRQKPKFELETFYGQLQHILVVRFPSEESRVALRLPLEQDTFIFAAIRACVLDGDTQLKDLDIHFYSAVGNLDVVDITSIQCLVGRVKDREPNTWGIIDRSGSLARAIGTDEDSD
ncbi:hypothetical protein Hypma_010657 [Hypsizygus marmoreus]|uniref:Transposase family Tnp2 protein n=1 Tax=Hypsizygus marmoreus TaxID=39966 RepID=A0A369JLX3_HYPMA|nr:hypothetical protein Hypma_010657 [Hypsizygus marmoreus]